IAAYRVSMILGTSVPLMVAGTWNWFAGFLSCAGLLGLVFAYNFFLLPTPPAPSTPEAAAPTLNRTQRVEGRLSWLHEIAALLVVIGVVSAWKYHWIKTVYFTPLIVIVSLYLLSQIVYRWISAQPEQILGDLSAKARLIRHLHTYMEAFRSYLDQERIGVILLFMLLYKLGDAMLFSMNTPFLLDLGVTTFQLCWLSGTVGNVRSIAGSLFGGWCVSRVGLRKGLWRLAVTMTVAILAYVWLAMAK